MIQYFFQYSGKNVSAVGQKSMENVEENDGSVPRPAAKNLGRSRSCGRSRNSRNIAAAGTSWKIAFSKEVFNQKVKKNRKTLKPVDNILKLEYKM